MQEPFRNNLTIYFNSFPKPNTLSFIEHNMQDKNYILIDKTFAIWPDDDLIFFIREKLRERVDVVVRSS